MSAFLGVTLLGAEKGFVLSVLISLFFKLWESLFPYIAVLGQLPDSTIYSDVLQNPDSIQHEGILIVQINSPIHFMNANNIRLKVQMYEKRASDNLSIQNRDCIKFVIISMNFISQVDAYALRMLNELARSLKMKNIWMMLVNPHVNVIEQMIASNIIDSNGSGMMFVSISDAVAWSLDHWNMTVLELSGGTGTIEEMDNTSHHSRERLMNIPLAETNGF
jgi:sulfate permease, SulP family